MKKLILVLLLIGFAGCTYSEGERTGVITKFSKKGIFIKTWEGTMILGAEGASGGIENTWDFTVKKSTQDVIDQVNVAARSGKLITVGYKEVIPRFFWVGDTRYYITGILPKGTAALENRRSETK